MAGFERLEELVIGLHARGALTFSEFGGIHSSGRRTPVNFNLGRVTSFKEGLVVNGLEVSIRQQMRIRDLTVAALAEVIDGLQTPPQHIFSGPRASAALSALVAEELGESFIWQRQKSKDNGRARPTIYGDFNPEDTVAIISDNMTDGRSQIQDYRAIRNNGLQTSAIAVLLDQQEDGTKELAKAGEISSTEINLIAVTGLGTVLHILQDKNRIGQEVTEWVAEYHNDLQARGIQTTFSVS